MDNITFDEFKKLDLRVGEIKAAEDVPGADRIYKLSVEIGGELKELVAGIKGHYEKDSLVGKKIIVLTNLEPRVIRGITSHGMLLAASEGKTVEVLFVDHAPPGERVVLAGTTGPAPAEIMDIDTFFAMPIGVTDMRVTVGDAGLECAGRPVSTAKVAKGRVK